MSTSSVCSICGSPLGRSGEALHWREKPICPSCHAGLCPPSPIIEAPTREGFAQVLMPRRKGDATSLNWTLRIAMAICFGILAIIIFTAI